MFSLDAADDPEADSYPGWTALSGTQTEILPVKAPARVLLLLVSTFAGCSPSPSSPQEEVRQLEKADSFELYSLEPLLDPSTYEVDYDPNGAGKRLHGWRILGKTTVRDEPTRRELIDALKMDPGKGNGAKCFWPRHAIRRTHNGKPVDLLICFECGNIALFVDGKRISEYEGVARNAQSQLDAVLTKAEIPLAKKKQNPKD
jgi:hypothetical protein